MATQLRKIGALKGASGSSLAVAPDGQVSIAASTGTASIWAGGELTHRVALPGYVGGPIAFALGGRQARIGPWVVDISTGETFATRVNIELLTSGIDFAQRAPPRFYSPRASAPSADGKRIAATFVYAPSRGIGDDIVNTGPAGQLVLVDPVAGQLVAVLENLGGLMNGRVLAINATHIVAAGGGVRVWSSTNGSLVGEDLGGRVLRTDIRINPKGTHLAASGATGTIEIRPLADVGHVLTWEGHSDRARAVAFHPSLPLLATGGEDKLVKLWSLANDAAELVAWFAVEGDVAALEFNPFGKHLLIAVHDEVIVAELTGVTE